MPTGIYKRTTYHKKRQREGMANSTYKKTEEHKKKIAEGLKKSWDNKKKGIKVCKCCGKLLEE